MKCQSTPAVAGNDAMAKLPGLPVQRVLWNRIYRAIPHFDMPFIGGEPEKPADFTDSRATAFLKKDACCVGDWREMGIDENHIAALQLWRHQIVGYKQCVTIADILKQRWPVHEVDWFNGNLHGH